MFVIMSTRENIRLIARTPFQNDWMEFNKIMQTHIDKIQVVVNLCQMLKFITDLLLLTHIRISYPLDSLRMNQWNLKVASYLVLCLDSSDDRNLSSVIQESRPQFQNRIMAPVYVRSITRSTMYQKAPFC